MNLIEVCKERQDSAYVSPKITRKQGCFISLGREIIQSNNYENFAKKLARYLHVHSKFHERISSCSLDILLPYLS